MRSLFVDVGDNQINTPLNFEVAIVCSNAFTLSSYLPQHIYLVFSKSRTRNS